MLAAGEIPFLGEEDGYKYMLLEFPHGNIPPGSDKMINRLLDQKIRPVIAHPERNMEVMQKLEKIEPFVDQGCLLQVTSGSIAGQFGLCTAVCPQYVEQDWFIYWRLMPTIVDLDNLHWKRGVRRQQRL